MFGEKLSNNLGLPLATIFMSFIFIQERYFTQVHSLEVDWYSCRVEFKDKEAKIKAITDCATKHNYKLPAENSITAVQEEMKRLSSNDFDDSCFSKCLYESVNLIKDGKINLDEFGSYFKNSNISEPLLKEYSKLFADCVMEAEPKFKDEKEAPCKMYAMVDVCYFKKFEENKKRLEEICNKSAR